MFQAILETSMYFVSPGQNIRRSVRTNITKLSWTFSCSGNVFKNLDVLIGVLPVLLSEYSLARPRAPDKAAKVSSLPVFTACLPLSLFILFCLYNTTGHCYCHRDNRHT